MNILNNNNKFLQKSQFLNYNTNALSNISAHILDCDNINRLFYYLCEFFCSLCNYPLVQGITRIGNDFYLISEFDTSLNQFKLLDYIPLLKSNSDFKEIYYNLNMELNEKCDYLTYEYLATKYSLPQNNSFAQKAFLPLYCDNNLYGFILLDHSICEYFKNNTTKAFIDIMLVQASSTIKRICKNNVNLYINNPLTLNHPLLNCNLKEKESFTCITSLDGYIINCSEGSYNVFQYLNEELLSTKIFKYIHPLHKEIFINEYKNMLKSNKPYSSRILMINKNKTYTWVKFTCKYSYDDCNIINGIFFYIANHDYSDENILKDIDDPLCQNPINDIKTFFSSNIKGMFMIKKSTLLYANEIAMSYLGVSTLEDYSKKDLNTFFNFYLMENDNLSIESFTIEEIYEIYATRNISNFDIKAIRKKDNKMFKFNLFISPLSNSIFKDTTIIILDSENISSETEELRKTIAEKNELLNNAMKYDKLRCDFFANISHELRTPVNVIYSALQLLNVELPNYIGDFNNSSVKKRVKTMKQNCYRLIKLINNLIDSTKIESGYYQLFLGKYNIVSLIEDISLSVAEYVEDKEINLIFDTDIEEKMTYCDAEKIERIILNLISNAIKFTDKNGEIKISLEDKENYLLVSVSDTGIGIPSDKCSSIFQRFVQVDSNRKNEKEGSGIGLNLVKSLIELHKGEIWVDSTVGKGSIFTFKLPYCYNPDSISSNVITDTSFFEKDKIQTIEIEFSDIYV